MRGLPGLRCRFLTHGLYKLGRVVSAFVIETLSEFSDDTSTVIVGASEMPFTYGLTPYCFLK